MGLACLDVYLLDFLLTHSASRTCSWLHLSLALSSFLQWSNSQTFPVLWLLQFCAVIPVGCVNVENAFHRVHISIMFFSPSSSVTVGFRSDNWYVWTWVRYDSISVCLDTKLSFLFSARLGIAYTFFGGLNPSIRTSKELIQPIQKR